MSIRTASIRTASRTAIALVAALTSAACGGTCPEPESAPTSGRTTASTTTGGERPMLLAEIDAPESIAVTLDGLGEGNRLEERHVANVFGCTGGNVSPAISWSGAPEGTRSFAIEVHDPDAPTGVGFFHWVVVDVPASTTSLPEGGSTSLPEGALATRTDYGAPGYGGPCPPPGAPHRYVFTVYALDTDRLGVEEGASPAVVRFMLRGHTLALGRAVATFGFPAQ